MSFNCYISTKLNFLNFKTKSSKHIPNRGHVFGSSTFLGRVGGVRGSLSDVNEIDFAHFLKNIDTDIDLLKIDIEGYEIELINHLIDKSALLNVAKVYVETHERKFVALTEATDRMKRRVEDFGLSNKFFWDWH